MEEHQGYDIIGDVHGCAHTLERLLELMGYRVQAGVWRHPQRKALFLGDIIDRGPRIREALHIVHGMVEAGEAQCIMGNHEFNALCWETRAPAGSGREYLRDHNERHLRLLAIPSNSLPRGHRSGVSSSSGSLSCLCFSISACSAWFTPAGMRD